MYQDKVEVPNKLGVHARPAALIVKTAAGFKANIHLAVKNDDVNAKSIMGVMTLAAGKGTEITVYAEGADEKEAVEALVALIAEGFGEE